MKKSSVHRLEKLLFALLTAALLNLILLFIPLLHQAGETALDSPEGILNAQGSSSGDSGGQGKPDGDGSGLQDTLSGDSSLQTSQGGVSGLQDSKKDADSQSALQEFLPSSAKNLPKDMVTLCLTGDLMCLAGQQYTAELPDGSHDYSGSFKIIEKILKDDERTSGQRAAKLQRPCGLSGFSKTSGFYAPCNGK